MKDGIMNQINNPHFYEDSRYDGTFEDTINAWLNYENMTPPLMHLWLPASATKEQVELVKKMLCGRI